MRHKFLNRLLGLLLASVMATTLIACGNEAGNNMQESSSVSIQTGGQESEGVTYPLEGNVTLTLAIRDEPQVTTGGAKNLFETPFGKAWQEKTGVTIEVLQFADVNAMNLLFAGGDLPDLIWHGFDAGEYAGGSTKAIADKVIEPLNDYIEYLPDMMAALSTNPDFLKASTTDDGDIIGGPFVRADEKLKTSAGIILRKDWLDELGLNIPKTPDEVYSVLKAFKELKGAEVPWSSRLWWFQNIGLNQGLITSPFGLVKATYYQVDGTVHYGYYEKEYKEVLTWLNKLYNDGLLDPNFQTLDDATMKSNIMNGKSGMMITSNGGVSTFLGTMADSDPEYNLIGISPLVAKRDDVAMSTHYDNPTTGYFLTITPNCKNKEVAAKFINYGYTEEGQMLFNFGIEGESYNIVDGCPTYTDIILKNPDGLTTQQAMAQYNRSWMNGPFLQLEEAVDGYLALEQEKEALEAWSVSNAKKYQLPAVTIGQEDASELSKLKADIDVYVGECMVKYVTGQLSLDTFETEYLPTLKAMGVEKVISIYQKALDNYNAR